MSSDREMPMPADAGAWQDAMSRRAMLKNGLAAGAMLATGRAVASAADPPVDIPIPPRTKGSAPPPKIYEMKKSINLWAFPYPQKFTLRQCLQLAKDAGFDGIELNYDLESDISVKAGPK